MDVEKFKQQVKQKYGSLNRFARTANIQAIEMYGVLKKAENKEYENDYQNLIKLANECEVVPMPEDWSDGLGRKIKVAIVSQYNTISEFNRQFPKYENSWITAVINDRKTYVTRKIKMLCEMLGVNWVHPDSVGVNKEQEDVS